jgi:ATP-dependent Clp protease ATP-binding subunit ClpA
MHVRRGIQKVLLKKPSTANDRCDNTWWEHIEKNAACARQFQQVLVKEPSNDTVSKLRILRHIEYKALHGVRIIDAVALLATSSF